jgi:hypothetical protein
MLAQDMLRRNAKLRSRRVALTFAGQEITYGELAELYLHIPARRTRRPRSDSGRGRFTRLRWARVTQPTAQSTLFTRSVQSSGISAAAPQSDANPLQRPPPLRAHLLFSWAVATPGAGIENPRVGGSIPSLGTSDFAPLRILNFGLVSPLVSRRAGSTAI